ncbi:hypothetical protein F5883DRAFT_651287 [Diaporthe sp. PMI_573]|nr:hypothetical protein F5883DRAFT_656467 [Diaporthaceae sp. PMI_573]KAH8752767.1 hypothetical protein F5883DRAFT_651287 [Diaporthaceae sp. PMI_573]
MDGREVQDFLTSRGLTRSGSRKRSSSQITQDEDAETEDVYQERWERRSRHFSGVNTSSDDLDPEMRRIQDNTRWYDEFGQFSRARDFRQEQIEGNSQWYDREFGQLSELPAPGVPQADVWDDYDECDDIDRERRRGVERSRPSRHVSGSPDVGSSPDSERIPNLSRSFTSHGSNRSSALLDPLAHDDDELQQGMILNSSITGDKISRVGRMGRDPSRK